MSTRELARKLGAIEVIDVRQYQRLCNNQQFDYFLVLDFEATCWSDPKHAYPSEIIEFPVVLYDTATCTICDEFQQYVKPTEHPQLTDFCKQLTGIQQEQIDNGVSLIDCLQLFRKWIDTNRDKYEMEFPHETTIARKKCVFVTWSNWDLGTCLRKECQRKKIQLPEIYRVWIDLRAAYKKQYRRRLTGLSGALLEVGLQFEGNEHCGLHDARNTAKLAGKMICDGATFTLTRTK